MDIILFYRTDATSGFLIEMQNTNMPNKAFMFPEAAMAQMYNFEMSTELFYSSPAITKQISLHNILCCSIHVI